MNTHDDFSGFRLPPPAGEASSSLTGGNFPSTAAKNHDNPRKKRTKLMRIDDNPIGLSPIGGVSKPKYGKKPDPSAPKITRPCSECGKKFWSWKALFGHMRCHPERQWRGINPPPNLRRPPSPETARDHRVETEAVTEEDQEVASCLLMLANGGTTTSTFETPIGTTNTTTSTSTGTVFNLGNLEFGTFFRDMAMGGSSGGDGGGTSGGSGSNCRFECSSCKKVFGSHQALGGHRASHKNVKGCFAITRCDSEDAEERNGEGEVQEEKMMMVLGHKCSICLRVFSSGQALGGHKRCHWEKGDEPSSLTEGGVVHSREGCGLDLNLPAPVEDGSSCSYSSGLALDLSLRL